MGNMSYCRFENTSGDVIDCAEAIENREMTTDMSDYEREGLEILLDACERIVDMKDEIEDALRRWDEHEKKLEMEDEFHQLRADDKDFANQYGEDDFEEWLEIAGADY